MAFVQGFHLIATAIFVLGSAVVGLRLLWLASRTRQAPELLLGAAVLLTAGLGYGLLVALIIVRSTLEPGHLPSAIVYLTGLGRGFHDLGVCLFLAFVVKVFRPGERWAQVLAGGAMALLLVGLVWGGANGSFRSEVGNVMEASWWCEYAVIWTYSLWLSAESFRYWRLMRKRSALMLADPMVTNRFLLWGSGSLGTFFAVAFASVPFFLLDRPQLATTLAPAIYVATAVAGCFSISCSYLAFLPPAWFERRVRARGAVASA